MTGIVTESKIYDELKTALITHERRAGLPQHKEGREPPLNPFVRLAPEDENIRGSQARRNNQQAAHNF